MRSSIDVHELADEIHRRLRACGETKRRDAAQWYFPSSLRALGVSVPQMRVIVRDVARRVKPATAEEVLGLAQTLVDARTLEGRGVAFELVARHREARESLTARTVEALGKGNDNWGSVDAFSVFVAGPAWRERRVSDAAVRKWARARDRWWRRTALVCTVALNSKARGGVGDAKRTLAIAEMLVGDHDDMVVKAMSWALRELGKRDAVAVRAFVLRHRDALHPRVVREVGRKLETGRKSGAVPELPQRTRT